jgi:hypothetical protein
MAKTKTISSKLNDDLATVIIPFDLFTGLSLITEELKSKGFKYAHMINEHAVTLIFESTKLKEKVSVIVEKENILIRQFTMDGDNRKLKVLYVLKPSQREFKLL